MIYFSGYNILLLSWSRWRHNASGFKRSNGLPGARLAERLTWQPINHSAKHASPHHRRRMCLYSLKKHICAPTHMRMVSKSKTRFSTCIALGIVVLEPTSILSFLIINYTSYFCLHRSCQAFVYIASNRSVGLRSPAAMSLRVLKKVPPS